MKVCVLLWKTLIKNMTSQLILIWILRTAWINLHRTFIQRWEDWNLNSLYRRRRLTLWWWMVEKLPINKPNSDSNITKVLSKEKPRTDGLHACWHVSPLCCTDKKRIQNVALPVASSTPKPLCHIYSVRFSENNTCAHWTDCTLHV